MEFTRHNHAYSAHVFTRIISALALVALMAGCSSAAREASAPSDPAKVEPNTTSGATLFSVGGSVSGLLGSSLALQNNARDYLAIGKDGNFQFAAALAKESAYKVSVLTQPSAPSQTCIVTQGSGTLAAANVANVTVACTTNTYTVGVTVTGLTSTAGLVLQLNSAHDLPISANGTFTFDTPIPSAGPYSVTVLTNPAMPIQTCIVTQGIGTVTDANIDTVAIACTTNAYSVSGSVSGLAGSGLVLQNNKGDNLALGVPANGNANFNFAIAVASGNPYSVSVLTQPSSPTQTCAVTNASGTIGASGVANVVVACTTNTYSVSGNVAGLTGSGLVLNNNGTVVSLAGNSFALTLTSGTKYNIGVTTQPSNPAQVCSVNNGSGTVTSANISNISVTCSTSSFSVGGSVSGLAAGSSVILQNNSGDNLTVSSNSAFTFLAPVASGAKYSVSVLTQPGSPSQTCTVANGTGSIGNAAVTNVAITCVINNFTVGGTITGLSGSGLVLRNNGANDLTVAANSGSFTFTTAVASNAPYAVTVFTDPNNPSQTCSVTGGSGTVTTASITSVSINCTTNTYTISGSVTGLAGTGLILQNNGADNYPVSANGNFTFATKIASNGKYVVTVLTQPASLTQTCSVTNGSSNVTNVNISNVVVNCVTNNYTVTGNVTGLAGTGLVLTNSSKPILLNANNTFTLTLASGTAYNIVVGTQPSTPTQNCSVTNPSGNVTNANISNVSINCVTITYPVTATAGANGTITPGSAVVNQGATFSFTVTPNTGYTADISGCFGTTVTNVAGPTITYATGPVTAACTVTANFTIIAYAISGAANPVLGGTVTTTTLTVNYNSTANFTITAAVGYSIASVSGCGGAPLANVASPITYATGAVTAACTVTANFSLNSYTVTATAGANGTITPASTTVNHGLTISFTVTPSAGYRAIVTGCGGTLANGIYTTAAITADCTVTASFAIMPRIAAGSGHTCALSSAGAVQCWGNNYSGQLGNGSSGTGTVSLTPVPVTGLSGPATALAAGDGHTCALTSAGAVQCWGYNLFGQLGIGGTGSNSPIPIQVTGLSGPVTALVAGEQHTCALTSGGAVQCWGWNFYGQLGIGSATNSSIPVTVTGLSGPVTALAAGNYHTCALTSAGAVQCWGNNGYGQLGNGNTINFATPVTVTGLSGPVTALAAGRIHTCALMTSMGGVQCWGWNFYGQLGNNSTTDSLIPVTAAGLSGPVKVLVTGDNYTCGLTSTGAVQCWGLNSVGQLGNSSTTNSAAPVTVGLSGPATALAAGTDHNCALISTGAVQCWGNNSSGELGNGSTPNSATPVTVVGLSL